MRITWMNNVAVYTVCLQGVGALKICQYTEQSQQQTPKAHKLCEADVSTTGSAI